MSRNQEKSIDELSRMFEASFEQNWLPEEMLKEYSPTECLAENAYCTTLLMQHRQSGIKCVAKCYNKENGSVIVTENEILSGISHKGLPKYMGKYENEQTICVLREYIDGMPLDRIIRKNTLTTDEVVQIALKMCDILDYLHTLPAPVIHRDIKPENIVIDKNGGVYLIDFGISRIIRDAEKRDTKIAATAVYAPPEQFGFLPTDARSDIYALGVLLSEMLTGKTRLDETLVDAGLGRIIKKCTEFSPKDRFSSVKQLAGGIKRWKRRHILLALKIAAVAAAAALAVCGIICGVKALQMPENGSTAVEEHISSSGEKDGISWTFDNTSGVLTVSGTGELTEPLWFDSGEVTASKIKHIIINEGITGIGNINCRSYISLQSIAIPGSAADNIAEDAFADIMFLEHVTVGPEKETGVGWIYDAKAQTLEVTYNGTGTGEISGENLWHRKAFVDYSNIRYAVINEGITSLGFNVFWNHSILEKLELPASLMNIDFSNFADTPSLHTVTVHPDNIIFYSVQNALYGASGRTGVKTLYFVPRNHAGKFEIDSDTRIIGKFAFAECGSITRIAIPYTVNEIQGSAFVRTEELTGFDIEAESAYHFDPKNSVLFKTSEEQGRDGNILNVMYIVVALPSISGHYTVPAGYDCVYINDGAFCGCTQLTQVTIPISVQSIGAGAFIDCTSLTTVNLPADISGTMVNGVKIDGWDYLGYGLFEGSGIESITIPYGVTGIPDYCFYKCSSLKEVYIPETVTVINEAAFNGCSALETLVIENSNVEIGESVFDGCYRLDKSEIPGQAE